MQIAPGQKLLIELDHLARGARFRSQRFELFLAAVDEHDLIGRAESDALVDEILKAFVFEFHFYLRRTDDSPAQFLILVLGADRPPLRALSDTRLPLRSLSATLGLCPPLALAHACALI